MAMLISTCIYLGSSPNHLAMPTCNIGMLRCTLSRHCNTSRGLLLAARYTTMCLLVGCRRAKSIEMYDATLIQRPGMALRLQATLGIRLHRLILHFARKRDCLRWNTDSISPMSSLQITYTLDSSPKPGNLPGSGP